MKIPTINDFISWLNIIILAGRLLQFGDAHPARLIPKILLRIYHEKNITSANTYTEHKGHKLKAIYYYCKTATQKPFATLLSIDMNHSDKIITTTHNTKST